MERQIITKRIQEITDDISRLKSALCAMDTIDIQRYPDNYEVLSKDAALRAEKIACRLRHLIYSSTGIMKKDYLDSAGAIHGILIKQQDNVMEIALPSLLPKRKQRQCSEFLLDPFYYAFSRYAETHDIRKYRHCVVCFSHVYSRELPTRRIRDYDNLELKQILDVIAAFIMVDDTGLLCDAYNTTEFGDIDCTSIFVMDKDRFSGWLSERENSMESITDF